MCIVKISSDTLQQIKKLKYCGIVAQVTNGRTRRFIHRLVKQALHYMSFIASLSQTENFPYITKQTVFKSFFILILTTGHES